MTVTLRGHLRSRSVARVVYGSIVGLALVVALEDHPATAAATAAIVENVTAVAIGAGFPAVFFLLAATGAIELGTAFSLAKWSGLGLISFYGFAAARLGGTDLKGAVLQGVAVGAIGALVIAIKALVH